MTFLPWPMAPESATGRLLGYARVSTYDQKLDIQLDALNRAGCAEVFCDHGVSGGVAARDGLDRMLATLKQGDTLVVYKLDRLGRSVLHLADLLTRLNNDDIMFCSLTEGIDTTTSGGKLVFHVFAAVAEFHRDLIRENTRAGLKAARERGVTIGRPRLMSIEDVIEAHRYMHQEGKTIQQTAQRFEVSESTVQRGLRRVSFDEAA